MNLGSEMATKTGPMSPIDSGQGGEFRSLQIRALGASDCDVALETSPDGSNWTTRVHVHGLRWESAATDVEDRYARANVISLGSGPSVSVLITGHSLVGTPSGPPPSGMITGQPNAQPFHWALWKVTTGLAASGSEFGHGDVTGGALVQTMTVTPNPGASVAQNDQLLAFVAVDRGGQIDISDPLDPGWISMGPIYGFNIALWAWTLDGASPHADTDAITFNAQNPVKMLGGVYNLGQGASRNNQATDQNGSTASNPWETVEPDMSAGGSLTIAVASPDCFYRPNGPTGWSTIGTIDGTGSGTAQGLSMGVYRGDYP